MAIPVTNIPVLTGEVAERFIEQCEYNAQHLRGSEYRGEFERPSLFGHSNNFATLSFYLSQVPTYYSFTFIYCPRGRVNLRFSLL